MSESVRRSHAHVTDVSAGRRPDDVDDLPQEHAEAVATARTKIAPLAITFSGGWYVNRTVGAALAYFGTKIVPNILILLLNIRS